MPTRFEKESLEKLIERPSLLCFKKYLGERCPAAAFLALILEFSVNQNRYEVYE